MKKEEYEKIQFKVQRIFPPLELGSILRHSLGGQGFVNFMRRIKLGGYELTVDDWDNEDITAQNKIIVDNTPYFFCHDPAIELGFPELDFDDIADVVKIYSPITDEAKLRKLTEENARLYIDALNHANLSVIREISEMPMLVLDEHIKKILKSKDNTLRWKTAWALAVDDKLTRVKHISKLKYKSKEEVIADYPYVFRSKSSGGMGLTFRENTLGMDEEMVMVQLAVFRLYQQGRRLEELTSDPNLLYIEMLVDHEAELKIYDQYAKKLSDSIRRKEEQVGAYNLRITGLEEKLRVAGEAQETLRQKVAGLEKNGQVPIAAAPKPSGDYSSARRRAEKAERNAQELTGKLSACNKEKLGLADEVNGLKQTAKNQKFMLDLLSIKCALCDFYSGLTVAVICDEGHPDKWSEHITQFGANVEVVQASDRVRQLGSLAESRRYDLFLFPVSTGSHDVTNILPPFKTITYDPGKGSIPYVLLRSIDRLRKAGVGAK